MYDSNHICKYKEGDKFLWQGEFGKGTKDQQKFAYICLVTRVEKFRLWYKVIKSLTKREMGQEHDMMIESLAYEESQPIANVEITELVYL